MCGGPVDIKATPAPPFCSARCQQIDLGRWLGEKHSVPHVASSNDGEESRGDGHGELDES
ncbi:MAG: DNA gyrase inhibitor YacG [Pirellulales bacterium]|nr:DNA gyrase inhibitor YacG [Pirellulales bacterium]